MGEDLIKLHNKWAGSGWKSRMAADFEKMIRDFETTGRKRAAEVRMEDEEMKVLAELLSKRMEGKWERRQEEEEEKRRAIIERRMNALRREYDRQLQHSEAKFARDRAYAEQLLGEKEEELKRNMQLRHDDKETRLDLERRRLETIMNDINLGRDELNRARGEMKSTLERELERCRVERESLLERERRVEREERRMVEVEGMDEERRRGTVKVAALESTVQHMRDQLAREQEERMRLATVQEQLEHLQKEHAALKMKHTLLLEQSAGMKEQMRELEDCEGLRKEIERLHAQLRLARSSEREKEEREKRREETNERLLKESCSAKVNELKLILSMMSDKMKVTTRENEYLRKECRALRKEIIHGKRRTATEHSRHRESPTGGSDGEDSVISLSSSFDNDMHEIKKRISNIDACSQRLEETVAAVCVVSNADSLVRARGWSRRDTVDAMDTVELSNPSPAPFPPSTPPSATDRRVEGKNGAEKRVKEQRVIPAAATAAAFTSPEGDSTTFRPPMKRESSMEGVRVNDDAPPTLTRNTEEGKSATAAVQQLVQENKEEKEALPEGVDPVMAHYMKIIMAQRGERDEDKQKREQPALPPNQRIGSVPMRKEESEEDEVRFAMEVGGKGEDAASNDGFEW